MEDQLPIAKYNYGQDGRPRYSLTPKVPSLAGKMLHHLKNPGALS